jgi:hypothetical protein
VGVSCRCSPTKGRGRRTGSVGPPPAKRRTPGDASARRSEGGSGAFATSPAQRVPHRCATVTTARRSANIRKHHAELERCAVRQC